MIKNMLSEINQSQKVNDFMILLIRDIESSQIHRSKKWSLPGASGKKKVLIEGKKVQVI
jgi:hypothetical protein